MTNETKTKVEPVVTKPPSKLKKIWNVVKLFGISKDTETGQWKISFKKTF